MPNKTEYICYVKTEAPCTSWFRISYLDQCDANCSSHKSADCDCQNISECWKKERLWLCWVFSWPFSFTLARLKNPFRGHHKQFANQALTGRYLLTFSLPQWCSQPFPWAGTLSPWRPFQILLLQESCPEPGSSEGIPTWDLPAGENRNPVRWCKERSGYSSGALQCAVFGCSFD